MEVERYKILNTKILTEKLKDKISIIGIKKLKKKKMLI